MNTIVVGCGGIASWLCQGLIRFAPGFKVPSKITLWDGDKIEARNLDRQLFVLDDIGRFKVDALSSFLAMWSVQVRNAPDIEVVPRYFTSGAEVASGTVIFGCVDNHAARRAILETADMSGAGARAIICGNEFTDAEAYIYLPHWRDSGLDPRVYYPEIMTDNAGDPVRPAGCQGEVQVAAPQLALANMAAASMGLQLFYKWFIKDRPDQQDYMPVHHIQNEWGQSTLSVKQKLEAEQLKQQTRKEAAA